MSVQNLSTLMSTAQVAEHLGIRPRTVLDWVQHGRLPAPLRIGKAPMWEMHELATVIDAAREKRDEAAERPKPRSGAPVATGRNFRSAKELQLMLALRRANLWRACHLCELMALQGSVGVWASWLSIGWLANMPHLRGYN